MNQRTLSDSAVGELAELFRLLAQPNRVRILTCLGMDCRPVADVIRVTGLEQTNASFHLRLLREAGLVRAERRGRFIFYCLSDARLLDIVSSLSAWLREGPVCGSLGDKRRKGDTVRAAVERPGRSAKTTLRGLAMRKE